MGDELLAEVRAYLAEHAPDVLAAIDDADRSRILLVLQRSPLERLVASMQQARFYERRAASLQAAQDDSRRRDSPTLPSFVCLLQPTETSVLD